jgi:hypothetical protein
VRRSGAVRRARRRLLSMCVGADSRDGQQRVRQVLKIETIAVRCVSSCTEAASEARSFALSVTLLLTAGRMPAHTNRPLRHCPGASTVRIAGGSREDRSPHRKRCGASGSWTASQTMRRVWFMERFARFPVRSAKRALLINLLDCCLSGADQRNVWTWLPARKRSARHLHAD